MMVLRICTTTAAVASRVNHLWSADTAYHRPPTQGISGPAARERSGAGMISVLEDAGSPGERQA